MGNDAEVVAIRSGPPRAAIESKSSRGRKFRERPSRAKGALNLFNPPGCWACSVRRASSSRQSCAAGAIVSSGCPARHEEVAGPDAAPAPCGGIR